MSKKNTVREAHDRLEKAETAVADAVAPYRKTLPIRALSAFSELGDQPPMIAISAATLAAGIATRNARLARAGGRMLAAHMIATAAKNFVKRRIDRSRPRKVVAGNGSAKARKGRNRSKEETSFPSGHTAGAVAVARAFAREYPEHAAPAYGGAGAISLAQIPRCAHYPSDVGVGAMIGLAAELIVDRAARGAAAVTAQDREDENPTALVV